MDGCELGLGLMILIGRVGLKCLVWTFYVYRDLIFICRVFMLLEKVKKNCNYMLFL